MDQRNKKLKNKLTDPKNKQLNKLINKSRKDIGEEYWESIQEDKYARYLTSKKWYTLKDIILEHQNHKCFFCNKKEKLQLHHISYSNIYKEKAEDVVAVCRNCHEFCHKGGV